MVDECRSKGCISEAEFNNFMDTREGLKALKPVSPEVVAQHDLTDVFARLVEEGKPESFAAGGPNKGTPLKAAVVALYGEDIGANIIKAQWETFLATDEGTEPTEPLPLPIPDAE
jgi:hypothetical protein